MQTVQILTLIAVGISLMLSVLSLALVFAWRKTSPEVSDLRSSLSNLAMDQAAIIDKFTHYMQRNDAREARNGKKRKREQADEDEYEYVQASAEGNGLPLSPTQAKMALRKQIMARTKA